jgi:hypothetical protein
MGGRYWLIVVSLVCVCVCFLSLWGEGQAWRIALCPAGGADLPAMVATHAPSSPLFFEGGGPLTHLRPLYFLRGVGHVCVRVCV